MTPLARTGRGGQRSASPTSDSNGGRLDAAVEVLAQDGCVGFPTETVWGLACPARSPVAVRALRNWKGRGSDQPISLLVSGPEVLGANDFDLSPSAEQIMRAFWPGPLTLILPCRADFAPGIARADGAVGIRCSSHPLAAQFARRAELEGLGPLTATSLNRSGDPPARNQTEARLLCEGDPSAPALLFAPGQDAHDNSPSTVLDLSVSPARILREGGVKSDSLRPFLEAGAPGQSDIPPRGDSGR